MWTHLIRPGPGRTGWRNAGAAAALILLTALIFAAGYYCGSGAAGP